MFQKNVYKVGLVGCGMVGTSFVYSLLHHEIEIEFILVDLNEKLVKGNVMDLQDATELLDKRNSTLSLGTYSDLKSADLIVITAGRAQRAGETRLEMIKDNSKIMTNIAEKIKESGFKGISIIASNPVDTLTYVYQKVTNFSKEKVIGSGTVLDTARWRIELKKHLSKSDFDFKKTLIAGEHGDSSFVIFEKNTIDGNTRKLIKKYKIASHRLAAHKAYEIIENKGSSFYGIGVALAKIVVSILQNKKWVLSVGVIMKEPVSQQNYVVGMPALLGINGIEEIYSSDLDDEAKADLEKSSKVIIENIDSIYKK